MLVVSFKFECVFLTVRGVMNNMLLYALAFLVYLKAVDYLWKYTLTTNGKALIELDVFVALSLYSTLFVPHH